MSDRSVIERRDLYRLMLTKDDAYYVFSMVRFPAYSVLDLSRGESENNTEFWSIGCILLFETIVGYPRH